MTTRSTQAASPTASTEPDADPVPPRTAVGIALAAARIVLGWVFLWAFLDKTFGLGFATTEADSWLAGGSPTSGFLASREGVFAGAFHALVGHAWVDWAFMLGMLLVGAALILGVAMRPAAVGAVGLMASLWLASVPLENNPVVDEHVVYAVLAVTLAATRAGHRLGAGRYWARLPLVRRLPWLA